MDADDANDFNESTLCVYYFDESSSDWIKLRRDLDWVYELGVNTTNVEMYGVEYEGYVWVNVSHLSLFGLGGKLNQESVDEDDDEEKDVAFMILFILLVILICALAMVSHAPNNHFRRKS